MSLPRPATPDSRRPTTAEIGSARMVGDRVLVTGEIDMSNAALLRRALEEAGRTGADLVVDLTEVSYLDSAAMAILWLQAEPARLRLVVRAGSVAERIFRLTGLDELASVEVVC